MRKVLLLVLLVPVVLSCSQLVHPNVMSADLSIMKQQTVYIMKRLKIPMRKNVFKDGEIRLTKYTSIYLGANFGAKGFKPYPVLTEKDLADRWYIEPTIAMSSVIDSIVFEKKDTAIDVKIRSISIILHELSHYLQVTMPKEGEHLISDIKLQMLQPAQFEAYAVDMYYYLAFTEKKRLKNILKSHSAQEEKIKAIFNSYLKKVYPNLPIVF